MQRSTVAWAAFVLFLAVALGAFGAHGIGAKVDARAYHNWSTAAQYQFYHGLALLGLAALEGRIQAEAPSAWSAPCSLPVSCCSAVRFTY